MRRCYFSRVYYDFDNTVKHSYKASYNQRGWVQRELIFVQWADFIKSCFVYGDFRNGGVQAIRLQHN